MTRVLLDHSGGFAIQRQQSGRWQTIQRVNTMSEATFVLDRLPGPIHPSSLKVRRTRASLKGAA